MKEITEKIFFRFDRDFSQTHGFIKARSGIHKRSAMSIKKDE